MINTIIAITSGFFLFLGLAVIYSVRAIRDETKTTGYIVKESEQK